MHTVDTTQVEVHNGVYGAATLAFKLENPTCVRRIRGSHTIMVLMQSAWELYDYWLDNGIWKFVQVSR